MDEDKKELEEALAKQNELLLRGQNDETLNELIRELIKK